MHFLLINLVILLFASSSIGPKCMVKIPAISQEYSGECRRGLAHGNGFANGRDIYQGNFRRGLPHGSGKYIWSNGDFYEGDWRNGKRHGHGTFFMAQIDSTFYGLWMNDEFKRMVDTLGVRTPDYRIHYQRNLTNIRFIRTGDGDKVLFTMREPSANRNISNLSTFGTSGSYINYTRHFGYEHAEFPFEGKISFLAPSKSGMVVYQIELFFEIFEPGIWEVHLNF
jgi:hypothetical protein